MQEGGPNPKIDVGKIRFDFTTSRYPRGMASSGDIAYKSDGAASSNKYLKVYRGASLTLPIPFPKNGSGFYLNQYSITMEVKLDEWPEKQLALLQMSNLGEVTVRHDGLVGADSFGIDKSNSIKKDRWHIVTISVDCIAGLMTIYLDGKVSATLHSIDLNRDGKFALNRYLTVFANKDANFTLGANIKLLILETKPLNQNEVTTLFEAIQAESAWTCQNCTYWNKSAVERCQACDAAKPSQLSLDNFWICKACTFQNMKGTNCSVCDTPRE